jgi:Flp pilus assembly protein protease CpaA
VFYAFSADGNLIGRVVVLPGIAFIILFACYHIGMMGGSDVKLLKALMPLIGFANISQFALHTILVGSLVALVVLLHSKVGKARGVIPKNDTPSVRYGVAIAAGTMTSERMVSKILSYWGMFFKRSRTISDCRSVAKE